MNGHAAAQLGRFLRLSAFAFVMALPATSGSLSWSSLWALGVGALETGFRQVFPVRPVPDVDAVLAAPDKTEQS